jgi:ABC-type multidrug transport system permease subunit
MAGLDRDGAGACAACAQRDLPGAGSRDPGDPCPRDLLPRADQRLRQPHPPPRIRHPQLPELPDPGELLGAGFTGAATGVNLARDIEQGWFDRLLAAPAPRPVLLAGLVLSASLRSLLPATFLLIVGFIVGVHWPGLLGLLLALFLVMGMAVVAATWGTSLAFRFRTQSAAPLMQIGMLLAVLTTTAYAPQNLLTGWLQTVAKYNPVTQVVEAARQGFVGTVTWSDTWPGLVTLVGLAALLSFFALRGMRRMTA